MIISSKHNTTNEGRLVPDGCKNCKEPFKKARAWQEFCGDKCRNAYHNRIKPFTLLDSYYATVKEAAQIAMVSETTIKKWASEERVTSVKHHGRIYILRSDLEKRVRRQEHTGKASPTAPENACTNISTGLPELEGTITNYKDAVIVNLRSR